MTQEEKQLLLKELCARLPYGIIVDNPDSYGGYWDEVVSVDVVRGTVMLLYNGRVFDIENVKPYLRPLSSITEKEMEEASDVIEIELKALQGPGGFTVENAASYAFEIDFYNKHHLDYRGLIEKGLALEAPVGMYKTE